MRIKIEDEYLQKQIMILEHAKAIIKKDGTDQLSMRKLAAAVQMTPGNLYHYYKSKEEVLLAVVKSGYAEIVDVIKETIHPERNAEEQLQTTIYAYIQAMLKNKEIYTIMMHSTNSIICQQTNILEPGIRMKRDSMAMLCNILEKGISDGFFFCTQVEITAQCIWCSMYGLLDRLINEAVTDSQQIEQLIQTQLHLILASIKRRTE